MEVEIVSIEAQNKFMRELIRRFAELQDPTMMTGVDMDEFRDLQHESDRFLKQFK